MSLSFSSSLPLLAVFSRYIRWTEGIRFRVGLCLFFDGYGGVLRGALPGVIVRGCGMQMPLEEADASAAAASWCSGSLTLSAADADGWIRLLVGVAGSGWMYQYHVAEVDTHGALDLSAGRVCLTLSTRALGPSTRCRGYGDLRRGGYVDIPGRAVGGRDLKSSDHPPGPLLDDVIIILSSL
ncbi:hypothetical protein C8R46DRAFT_1209939 [Mycena filopes]|nr:hypothetical protein C8R46DRAFT_1209939 [Mycena filopes]